MLGGDLPAGTRFLGPEPGALPSWGPGEHPLDADLAACVACGLCLPHCPTYRLTGEESASPRGRIAAMRAVAEGGAKVDATFASYIDLCLACRACEDVCPSHVAFGRLIEPARVQVEPHRPVGARLARWIGLEVAIRRRWLLSLARRFAPLARPLLPRRVSRLIPRGRPGPRVPSVTEPEPERAAKGTVAILTGCVQDQWYREVNRATARALARNGWRVLAPRRQVCCGALSAHNGHLETARALARRNLRAFGAVDHVIVNAAACGAQMKEYGQLLGTEEAHAFSTKVVDLMEFLAAQNVEPPSEDAGVTNVAFHDACHALRVQHIRDQPRAVLRTIPGLEVRDIAEGDRCCGAAGLYNIVQPEMAERLGRAKAEAILATEATTVATANPGCAMQLAAAIQAAGADVEVLHPVQLLDRAYRRRGTP